MPMAGRLHDALPILTKIGLLVASKESLMYWKERFEQFEVQHGEMTTYANRPALHFEDEDGLRLVLLVDSGRELANWEVWEQSTIPVEHQVRGMGSIEMTVRRPKKLIRTLTEVFGYTIVEQVGDEAILKSIYGEVYGVIFVKVCDGTCDN